MKKTFIVTIIDEMKVFTVARIHARSEKEARKKAQENGVDSIILDQLRSYSTFNHKKIISGILEDIN